MQRKISGSEVSQNSGCIQLRIAKIGLQLHRSKYPLRSFWETSESRWFAFFERVNFCTFDLYSSQPCIHHRCTFKTLENWWNIAWVNLSWMRPWLRMTFDSRPPLNLEKLLYAIICWANICHWLVWIITYSNWHITIMSIQPIWIIFLHLSIAI